MKKKNSGVESSFMSNNVMRVIRLGGEFLAIWPLDATASTGKVLFYETMWWIYLTNAIFVMMSLAFGIHCCQSSIVNLMKSLVEMTYISEALFNIVYCRRKKLLLTSLLVEMDKFNEISSPDEIKIKEPYLKRGISIFAILSTIFVVGALIFVFSPLVMNRRVPLNTIYAVIPLDEYWGYCTVYALNIFSILQASIAIIVDLLMIFILMHASYKFDLAGRKLHSATFRELHIYVRLHQKALSYATDADRVVAPIIVKSTGAVSMYIITCSLLILNNVPVFELTQFFLITFLSCLRLFVCSWSAELMTERARDIGELVYDMPWCSSPIRIRKLVLIIIHRCQQPVIISARGIIPALSLGFCGWVLYKTFSNFMTLRAIFHV